MSLLPTAAPLPRLQRERDIVVWARQLVETLQRHVHDLAATVNTLTPVLVLSEQVDTPAAPADGVAAHCYVRNDTFVVQFTDGATVRYLSIPLTGTGTTWTHGTVAP